MAHYLLVVSKNESLFLPAIETIRIVGPINQQPAVITLSNKLLQTSDGKLVGGSYCAKILCLLIDMQS